MPLTLANMSPWGKCGGEEVMERITAGSCYDHWSKREYQSNTNVLLNHLVITLTGCTKNCRAGVSYYQLTYVAPAYNPIFPFSPLPDYQTLLKWACFLAMPFFFFFLVRLNLWCSNLYELMTYLYPFDLLSRSGTPSSDICVQAKIFLHYVKSHLVTSQFASRGLNKSVAYHKKGLLFH